MMKDKYPGRLFIISAPSGTGKSTVIQKIMELRSDLSFSVSATTRPPRPGETEGVAYRFLSRSEFERMIAQNDFLEYAEFVGDFYGTPKQPVLDHVCKGEDVILDIDVQGCKQIKKAMPEAVSIFLIPPSMEELERRLRTRGTDSEDKVKYRLQRAKAEMLERNIYDFNVVNDIVDQAAHEIIKIIDQK
jgi:guanylate kinase